METIDAQEHVVDDANDPMTQWVTFHLEEEKYGVPVDQVKEVLRYTEITPVPGAPEYVLGIINLRGNVVTILDTRRRFALPEREPDDDTRFVILEVADNTVGILVDSVSEVMRLRQSEIEHAPNVGNDESSKYIQGVASRESNLLILVDLDKLLSDSEWQDVANL